ncbi:MAG: hypothetical protein CMO55_08240 [Verrucomicrobiales bacterium]|nr:hypothetical protein [Verrucomicrobiales bacterium]
MHDISFFLLKNWLTVGVAAIVFFGIGMLLAKVIWGRYAQRLATAVEENMNLANQWSALGASQQDLFKKLRSRWQEDRDAWETVISEKDARIDQLNETLTSSGKVVPENTAEREADRKKIAELEKTLKARDEEIDLLGREVEELREAPKMDAIPFMAAVTSKDEEESEIEGTADEVNDLQQRIKDLEQDLIDTHDELHDVRSGYLKQVELVESLEAKLIDAPEATSKLDEAESRILELETALAKAETAQGSDQRRLIQAAAIASQRGREISTFRASLFELKAGEAALSAKEAELLSEREQFAKDAEIERERLLGEMESEKKVVRSQFEKEAEQLRLKTEEEKQVLHQKIEDLQSALEIKANELREMQAKVEAGAEEAIKVERKKAALQTELNDACHEMYDVRAALHYRLDEIDLLEARIEELEAVEEEKERLSGDLTALNGELNDVRHELSDVRIAYNEKVKEFETARAEMEELEAIIEDRSSEVNDLSAEVRQQRDTIRQLKNTMATHEGELEALSDESGQLNAVLSAKVAFSEEQQIRIADLEKALSDRYRELNSTRAELDMQAKSAKYHASKSEQLEAELERRGAEFEASDRRVASAEEELEQANQRIAELTEKVEQSDKSLSEIQEELRVVSKEKEERIHELDLASKRISELETAARSRESQIADLEHELRHSQTNVGDLERKIERLGTQLEEASKVGESLREAEHKLYDSDSTIKELTRRLENLTSELEEAKEREAYLSGVETKLLSSESTTEELDRKLEVLQSELAEAREHRDSYQATIANLEEALKQSDDKTLELSNRLEQRESELGDLEAQLADVRNELDSRNASIEESSMRVSELQAELSSKAEEVNQLADSGTKVDRSELEALQQEFDDQESKLQQYVQQRQESIEEIEQLRQKLGKRSDSIRELQSQISTIMMQRASRDNEISLLKDKLRALEEQLRKGTGLGNNSAELASAEADQAFEKVLEQSLESEADDDTGTSLDELAEKESHHAVQSGKAPEASADPSPPSASNGGSAEDLVVYFEESSAGLSREEVAKIHRCATALRKSGRKMTITVIGFAGSEGTADYTESLSARRADAVRERLLERGVSQSAINVQSAGQDRRFSDWKARRVELILAPEAVAETVN